MSIPDSTALTHLARRVREISAAFDLDALLDEPTALLDLNTGDRLRGLLERFRELSGAAILLASRNMGEAERMAHRVLMMRIGRVVDDGTPAERLTHYGRASLEDVFFDVARSPRPAISGGGMNHERMRPPTAAMETALKALVLRHLRLLLFSSWARLVEIVYWPTMQMLLWGFITLFLTERADWLAQHCSRACCSWRCSTARSWTSTSPSRRSPQPCHPRRQSAPPLGDDRRHADGCRHPSRDRHGARRRWPGRFYQLRYLSPSAGHCCPSWWR